MHSAKHRLQHRLDLKPFAYYLHRQWHMQYTWALLLQVRAREEELLNLTSLYTATKASADKRIATLESRVAKLLEANR